MNDYDELIIDIGGIINLTTFYDLIVDVTTDSLILQEHNGLSGLELVLNDNKLTIISSGNWGSIKNIYSLSYIDVYHLKRQLKDIVKRINRRT